MGFEKQSSKGGYVGGFLQLFDWNAKSRKKLFSSKCDLPERAKQGKKSYANLPSTRLHLIDEDEIGTGSSIKGSSEYSCASSVTDEDGYGTRAPGVVARLMGLNSLPASNTMETYCSPLSDSLSLRDVQHEKKSINFHHSHEVVRSDSLFGKAELSTPTVMEPKSVPKLLKKPIEKFRTETLPPKSAKSIPATHHRLLSPIKNPSFHTTKNAAQIMEAAAKIIEQRPETYTKARVSPQGPSVPFKVRKLKERVEASEKPAKDPEFSRSRPPMESNAAKCLKGQSMNKSWSGSDDASLRTSTDAEENSSGFKKKGKSISLALQAKVNVQKRECLVSSGSRSACQKENVSQSDMQPITRKKVDVCSSTVALRQNNQKQNSRIDGRSLYPKPLTTSILQRRKVMPSESSVTPSRNLTKSRGSSKTGCRRMELRDGERGTPYSRKRSVPLKKRSLSSDLQPGRICVVNNVVINNKEKKHDCAADVHDLWADDGVNKGMDVVSFTFTTPMVRLTNASDSNLIVEQNKGSLPVSKVVQETGIMAEESHGGDALSALLEQKLKELSNGIISSKFRLRNESDNVNELEGPCHSGESPEQERRPEFEALVQMDNWSGDLIESRQLIDCRHPSPISILEPFSIESCNSSDSTDSNSTEGSLQCSSVQTQRVERLSCMKLQSLDADIELLDSASSISTCNSTCKQTPSAKPKEWELEYVKEVLSNVELMFEDYSLNGAVEILNPRSFCKLEVQRGNTGDQEMKSRIDRKELFECIGECLELRFKRYTVGSCKAWGEGIRMVRMKRGLADMVYKEISRWRGMSDCNVDELVDRDMSSSHQCGSWLDFEVEEFELGVEVVAQVMNGLIDETVADLFPLHF